MTSLLAKKHLIFLIGDFTQFLIRVNRAVNSHLAYIVSVWLLNPSISFHAVSGTVGRVSVQAVNHAAQSCVGS